ncbi:zinc finger protein 160-like isoform X2 [Lucilia sericata]|nr:zinc finger protein 160-like isoform X2 [Lucilia sericata]
MLIAENPLEKSIICLKCWNTIVDFHEFRRNIYNAHDNFKLKNNNLFHTKIEHITEDFGDSNEGQIEYKTITIKDENDLNQPVIDDVAFNLYEIVETVESNSMQDENSKASSPNKNEEMENFIADYMPKLECHKCFKIFYKFSLLRTHFREKHPRLQFYVTCCEKKFSVRSLLVHHINLHINPDLYKCIICGERKATQRNLDNHMRSVHKNSKDTYLNRNNQDGNIKESRLKKIEELDNYISKILPILKCYQCRKTFKKFTLLRQHFKQRHAMLRFYINCCERKIAQRADLAKHLRRLHVGDRKTTQRSLELHKQRLCKNNEPKKESIPCPHCNEQYASMKELNQHIKQTHNADIKDCETKPAVMNARINAKSRKKITCEICNKVLYGVVNLNRHNASMHHDGTTEYICSLCGKVSYTKTALMAHKSNVHVKVKKNYKCRVCGKAFSNSRDVEWHMSIHTKEKLSKCPDCNKKFTRPSNMLNHRKRTHPEEYEKHRKSTPRLKVDPEKISKIIVL